MDGGIVTKPTTALIGEKEPEIIVPQSKLPEMLSSPSENKNQGVVEKAKIQQKTNELMRTSNQSSLNAIKTIKENEKTKEQVTLAEKTEKENNSTKRNPKNNTSASSPTIPANEPYKPKLSGLTRNTTTKGISIFRDGKMQNPHWRTFKS